MPVSAAPDFAAPLAVAAHDAGAANLIFAWLAQRPDLAVSAVVAGPAEALWRARFPNRPTLDLDTALDGAAMLLSGTGWASDLEHRSRAAAAAREIRSVAVVDHWVNYRPRFQRADAEQLPDEIWVTDRWAADIARREFGSLPVVEQPNAYLAEQVAAIAPCPTAPALLYIGEPARSDWGRGTPGEFQAIDWLRAHLMETGLPDDAPVRLRPHPSESAGKYDTLFASDPRWSLDTSASLADAISSANCVAGMGSYAMVVALAAGRRVFSSLPPWAPPCALPHDGIVAIGCEQASTLDAAPAKTVLDSSGGPR